MVINDFFEKVERPVLSDLLMDEEDCLVSQIDYGLQDITEEELKLYDVAIIGIEDETNALNNEGCKDAIHAIRQRLAYLRKTTGEIKIIDLGNVRGKSLNDKYFVVREVSEFLLKNSIVGVIAGGSQDYTFPVVQALTNKEEEVNVAIVDSCIDSCKGEDFSSMNFIDFMVRHCNDKVSDVCFLGLQKYFTGKKQEDYIEKENWAAVRLKDLRGSKIKEAEPYLRDANVVSFDIGAVECSYVNTLHGRNVNGFNGNEACMLSWYAGMGIKNNFFCFHEFNPRIDLNHKGEILSAEIIWHFLEANSLRIKEYPAEDSPMYKIFVVHLHNFNKDIRFYKNRYNSRWWIEIDNEEVKWLVSCSESDYKMAQKGEVPDRWWRHLKKSQ